MKNKVFFSAFILFLVLLGVGLGKTIVPNQELILEFSKDQRATNKTELALTLITHQLEAIAVQDVKVEILANGALKISYFSELDTVHIKDKIEQAIGSSLKDSSYSLSNQDAQFPLEKENPYYKIAIYKTQDVTDIDGNATTIIEPKLKISRSTNYDVYAFLGKERLRDQTLTTKVAYRRFKYIGIANRTATYKIPEVRAGPIS